MSFFVTLTFDLTNASSDDYEFIEDELDSLGLYNELEGKKRSIKLPNNTYGGEFNGENTLEVKSYIAENVKIIFKKLTVKSTYFITVGSGWSWLKGST